MIDLNDIAIFAKVARLESFSRAARALGMPGHAMLGFKRGLS
jgi:DNA-binding transcriptional LysR family regulator